MKQRKILKLGKLEGIEIEEKVVTKKPVQGTKQFLTQATEVGFTIAIPISLGALLGVWLDNKFNSHPKLTLSLLFAGIFFAFTNLYLIVKNFSKRK